MKISAKNPHAYEKSPANEIVGRGWMASLSGSQRLSSLGFLLRFGLFFRLVVIGMVNTSVV